MTELQTNRYDQLLRRAGDLKGPGSKVNDALSELFPMIDVENLPPELLALAGWRTAWQSTERPAAALDNSASQLFNPPASGVLVAVTQIGIKTDVDDRPVQMEIVAAEMAGTRIPGLFRDSRFGVPRSTTAVTHSRDNVPVGAGLRWQSNILQQTIRDDNGLVVLTPGTGLSVGTVNDNLIMTVNYFWRERVAEPSELSF